MARSRQVVAIDKETGMVVRRHNSLEEAARSWDMTYKQANWMVYRHTLGKKRVMLRWLDSWSGYEDVARYKNVPVLVMSEKNTGLGRWYPTTKRAAAFLCVTNQTLTKAINENRPLSCGVRVKRITHVRSCALDGVSVRQSA